VAEPKVHPVQLTDCKEGLLAPDDVSLSWVQPPQAALRKFSMYASMMYYAFLPLEVQVDHLRHRAKVSL
jgi:hypothetical protein